MREYVTFLISMTVAFAVISAAAYKLTDKSVRLGMGIIFLCAAASPLFSLINDSSHLDIDVGYFESGIHEEYAEQALCLGLENGIRTEFGLKDGAAKVYLSGFSAEAMSAEKVKVILTSDAVGADVTAIRAYVKKCGFEECEVIYGIG